MVAPLVPNSFSGIHQPIRLNLMEPGQKNRPRHAQGRRRPGEKERRRENARRSTNLPEVHTPEERPRGGQAAQTRRWLQTLICINQSSCLYNPMGRALLCDGFAFLGTGPGDKELITHPGGPEESCPRTWTAHGPGTVRDHAAPPTQWGKQPGQNRSKILLERVLFALSRH